MQNKNQHTPDELLVRQIQSGDKMALNELVKRWHKLFCNKAFWIVKDSDVAKDIAQESWKTILDKISTLKDTKQFKSWALRIVCNKALDHTRITVRERLQKEDYKNTTSPYEDIAPEQVILKQKLLMAINDLPVHQHMVIKLFYIEGYSLNQISELLQISAGTAKSRLFYAREKLKKQLKIYNYEN